MNILKRVGMLGAVALIATGCEDITNPVEEFGQLADAFVRFEDSDDIGVPGSVVEVIFQMPTRVEEDVTITYTFGGDAVYGEDYVAVDADGNVRSDVTASGGTAHITYDPEQTLFGRDTLLLQVTPEATDGAVAQVTITQAVTESGRQIETGYIDTYRNFDLNIEGYVDTVPTGTYTGARGGDFGNAAASVTITKPATPVTVEGADYTYVLSDFQGNPAGLFGAPYPWAFNVTSGGTVVFAAYSHVAGPGLDADMDGDYDFATSTLSWDVLLNCCGAAGFGWFVDVSQ